jgi:hypothetical protein
LKLREIHSFYNNTKYPQGLDYNYDSIWGTPSQSGYKDRSECYSSASKAKRANVMWGRLNSTCEKQPILKRYRSDNTSQKKRDEKVRFKVLNGQERDSEYELTPQRLDFSNVDNLNVPMDREYNNYRHNNRGIMEDVEQSLEKEQSFWNIFGGNRRDPYNPRGVKMDRNTKVIDIRNVGSNEDHKQLNYDKHTYSYSSKRHLDTENKENFGDYDLIEEYDEVPIKRNLY